MDISRILGAPPEPPPTAKGRAMRRALTTAAASAFADIGYSKTTVSEIVSRAGTARTNFYKHFEDTSDVLVEVMREPLSEFLEAMRAGRPCDGDLTHEAVATWIHGSLVVRTRHERLLAAWREAVAADRSGPIAAKWSALRSALYAELAGWAEDVRRVEGFDDDIPATQLAEMLDVATEAVRRRWVQERGRPLTPSDLEQLADLMATATRRLIVPVDAPGTPTERSS